MGEVNPNDGRRGFIVDDKAIEELLTYRTNLKTDSLDRGGQDLALDTWGGGAGLRLNHG
jgi:hypothetical protein